MKALKISTASLWTVNILNTIVIYPWNLQLSVDLIQLRQRCCPTPTSPTPWTRSTASTTRRVGSRVTQASLSMPTATPTRTLTTLPAGEPSSLHSGTRQDGDLQDTWERRWPEASSCKIYSIQIHYTHCRYDLAVPFTFTTSGCGSKNMYCCIKWWPSLQCLKQIQITLTCCPICCYVKIKILGNNHHPERKWSC